MAEEDKGRYDKNPVVEQGVSKLLIYLRGLVRSGIVTHKEIEEETGIVYLSDPWQSLIEKARKEMLDTRGIWLSSVRGVGYKLLGQEEQTNDVPRALQRGARRRLRKAHRIVARVPAEELPMALRLVQQKRLESIEATERLLAQESRQQESLYQAQRVPRRPPSGGAAQE